MATPACGFIVVDKPAGVTSFSIVSLVRRLTGVRRVGHAGTLDPLASGVLPVAVGPATRFIEYLDDAAKIYSATVRFGVTTDTYDSEGTVTGSAEVPNLDRANLEGALAAFVGEITQVPPAYSALKVAGKPLYRYAREGTLIAVAARRVRIDRIDLRSLNPPEATLEVTCGKGTYIRSLAHDLGKRLGCGAHLAGLRRLASGGFTLDDAHATESLAALTAAGRLGAAMLAPDRALERRPAAILGDAYVSGLRAGRDVRFAGDAAALCRVYSLSGDFVGVLAQSGEDAWHPAKLLPPPLIGAEEVVFS